MKKLQPSKDNTFCPYPFSELTLKEWIDGKLQRTSPCCMMFNSNNPGIKFPFLKNKTPEEIFNSKEFTKLRKHLLEGKKNKLCNVCWKLEENNQTSFRLFGSPMSLEEIEKPSLNTIDLTLSNICNLRCRMCDTSSSNRLAIDYDIMDKQGTREELYEITQSFGHVFPKRNAKDSVQFKWLLENTDKITTLKASGGEPFYDKSIIALLQKYIDNGDAKNTVLHFHTNATMIDDRIIDIIKHFKRNEHTFSIDGTDKVYEYIRHEADWKKLNDNIQKYLQLDNLGTLNLNMVVSAHNIHNVFDYIEWAENYGIFNIIFSEVYPATRGIHLSNLPKSLLKPIYEKLEQNTYIVPQKNIDQLKEFLLLSMNKKMDSNSQQQLYRETVILDKARNQSYRDFLHPSMVKYLDHLEKMYLTYKSK